MRVLSVIKKIKRSLVYIVPCIYELYKFIKSENITNLKPVNFMNWHHGFMYFRGQFRGQKVFLKLDTKVHCVVNEKVFCDWLETNTSIQVPKVHLYSRNNSFSIAVLEFVDGCSLTMHKLKKSPEIIKELVDILKELNNAGICHRDIKLDNFIVNEKITLIDFTYAQVLDSGKELNLSVAEAPKNIEFDLGVIKTDSPWSWNDFYSMNSLFNEVDKFQFPESLNQTFEEIKILANSNEFTFVSKHITLVNREV